MIAGANCDQTYRGRDIGYWHSACVGLRGEANPAVRSDRLREQGLGYARDHAGRAPGRGGRAPAADVRASGSPCATSTSPRGARCRAGRWRWRRAGSCSRSASPGAVDAAPAAARAGDPAGAARAGDRHDADRLRLLALPLRGRRVADRARGGFAVDRVLRRRAARASARRRTYAVDVPSSTVRTVRPRRSKRRSIGALPVQHLGLQVGRAALDRERRDRLRQQLADARAAGARRPRPRRSRRGPSRGRRRRRGRRSAPRRRRHRGGHRDSLARVVEGEAAGHDSSVTDSASGAGSGPRASRATGPRGTRARAPRPGPGQAQPDALTAFELVGLREHRSRVDEMWLGGVLGHGFHCRNPARAAPGISRRIYGVFAPA